MAERLLDWLVGNSGQGVTALRFAFGVPLPVWLGFLLILASGLVVFFVYPKRLHGMKIPRKRVVVGLRILVVMMMLFLVLDPSLVGYRFDPRRNYLLFLFDDSASMSIAPSGQDSRGERVRRAYKAAVKDFEEPLKDRYQIARYRFGEGIQRIRDLDELTFKDRESRIAEAVKTALQDFQGINVAGVVVFSDGIQQPGLQDLNLLDTSVPVMTVSTGEADGFRDVQVERVSFTRAHGEKAPISVNLGFTAVGLEGERVIAEVRDRKGAVVTSTVSIEGPNEEHEIRLTFDAQAEGWQEYEVRVRPGRNAAGIAAVDEVPQNNSRRILVDNRRRDYKVFYFSGRPNWENKFVQMALKADKEIALTSVLRISAAETKFVYRGKQSSLMNPLFEGFYKNDVDQPRYDESVFLRFGGDRSLAGKGFPEDHKEIFDYDLVILGEVEANFFSLEQLELAREFVRKRGGALLMLGGPHSFSQGHYQDTVIASMLPILMERGDDQNGPEATASFKVAPTMEGILSGTWSLSGKPDESEALWNALPPLKGLNNFALVRPAAVTMAEAQGELVDGKPLFAMQRYGEGKTAVLATGATWQWHMGTDLKDKRHQAFWRQLVRGLGVDVQKPLIWRNKQDRYVTGKGMNVEILVRDALFDEKAGLRTRAVLTHPDGSLTRPGIEESLREPGVYRVSPLPEKAGTYRLNFSAETQAGESVGKIDEAFLVTPDRREYMQAQANPAGLAALAATTGGLSFSLDQLAEIPDQIPFVKHEESEAVKLPFWHFPPFFFLLVTALCAEWYLRRKRGHA